LPASGERLRPALCQGLSTAGRARGEQPDLHPGGATRARWPARPPLLELGAAGHAARGDHRPARPQCLTRPGPSRHRHRQQGIAGFLGLPVTPATLVVLPVVLGLAADYLIQSVNRVMESEGTLEERLTLAARRILPSTGLAAAATAAGMLAFVASGIPLIRQFGLF